MSSSQPVLTNLTDNDSVVSNKSDSDGDEEASDAEKASDGEDASDVEEASDAEDAEDVEQASDVEDESDVEKASDAEIASDAEKASNANDASGAEDADFSTNVAPPGTRDAQANEDEDADASKHSSFVQLGEETYAPRRSSSLAREDVISSALDEIGMPDIVTGASTPVISARSRRRSTSPNSAEAVVNTQASLPARAPSAPPTEEVAFSPSDNESSLGRALAESTPAPNRPKRTLRLKQQVARVPTPVEEEVEEVPDPIETFDDLGDAAESSQMNEDPIEPDASQQAAESAPVLSPRLAKAKGLKNRKGVLVPPAVVDNPLPLSTALEELMQPAPSAEPASPPVKRRPGRPRKDAPSDSPPTAKSVPKTMTTIVVKKQPITKPVKRPLPSSASAPSASIAATTSSTSGTSAAPRRRGRPPLPQEEKDRRAAIKRAEKEEAARLRAEEKARMSAEKKAEKGPKRKATKSSGNKTPVASQIGKLRGKAASPSLDHEDASAAPEKTSRLEQSMASWAALDAAAATSFAEEASQVDQLLSSLPASIHPTPEREVEEPFRLPLAEGAVKAAVGKAAVSGKDGIALPDFDEAAVAGGDEAVGEDEQAPDVQPTARVPSKRRTFSSPSVVPATQQTEKRSTQESDRPTAQPSQTQNSNNNDPPADVQQSPLFLGNVTQVEWPGLGNDSQLKSQASDPKPSTLSDDEEDDEEVSKDVLMSNPTSMRLQPPTRLQLPKSKPVRPSYPGLPSLSQISAQKNSYFSSPALTPANGYEKQLATATSIAFGLPRKGLLAPEAGDDGEEEDEDEDEGGSSSEEEKKSHIPKERKAGMPPKSWRKSGISALR